MKIRLYDQTESSMNGMDREANNFMREFMRDKSRTLDQETWDTLEQLKVTAFWRVLSAVDVNDGAREKARKTFRPEELVNLLSICVNQAITFPRATGWPGSLLGNSTVYRHFNTPGSLVREYAPDKPEFEVGLQNGRFWESLSDMRDCGTTTGVWNIANDVLTNHFRKLDPMFVKKGLGIIARQDATYGMPESIPAPKLYTLAHEAVARYGDFFLQVDDLPDVTLGVPRSKFREQFFTPYIERVLARDEDDSPEFPSYKSPSAIMLLSNEPCREILSRSPELRGSYKKVVDRE